MKDTRLLKVCVVWATSDLTFYKREAVLECSNKEKVSLSTLSHPKTEGKTCMALSAQTDVLSMSITIFNNLFLWTKNKRNNQQQKQPIQETTFNMLDPRNTVKTKDRKKSKYRIWTCHIVPWASFLSQKATNFTSFCSNKMNRHLKWLPAGWPSREKSRENKKVTYHHHVTGPCTWPCSISQNTHTHAPTHTASHATDTHARSL